jgi:hypothetical protein
MSAVEGKLADALCLMSAHLAQIHSLIAFGWIIDVKLHVN